MHKYHDTHTNIYVHIFKLNVGGDFRMASGSKSYTVLSGLCPDQQCQAKLFFPAHESSIECTQCGQRHEQKSLQDVQQVNNPEVSTDSVPHLEHPFFL